MGSVESCDALELWMEGGGRRLTGVEWVSVTRESNTRVEQENGI